MFNKLEETIYITIINMSRPRVTMGQSGIEIRKKANEELSKIFYVGLNKEGKF